MIYRKIILHDRLICLRLSKRHMVDHILKMISASMTLIGKYNSDAIIHDHVAEQLRKTDEDLSNGEDIDFTYAIKGLYELALYKQEMYQAARTVIQEFFVEIEEIPEVMAKWICLVKNDAQDDQLNMVLVLRELMSIYRDIERLEVNMLAEAKAQINDSSLCQMESSIP